MAGYFVKMDIDLAESEEVILLSEATGDSIETIIGKLFLFWRWVERHGGALRGVTRLTKIVTLSRVTGCNAQFLEALESVGWLVTQNGNFVIPGWEKRFSHTAKENATNADRQKRYRDRKKAQPEQNGVTHGRDISLRPTVTQALPEVEVETEVETDKKTPIVPKGTYPDSFQDFWNSYPEKVGKGVAFREWEKAVKRLKVERSVDAAAAGEILHAAAREFAASRVVKIGKFIPHARTWLSQSRYDDDRASWNRPAEDQSKFPGKPSFDPIEKLKQLDSQR